MAKEDFGNINRVGEEFGKLPKTLATSFKHIMDFATGAGGHARGAGKIFWDSAKGAGNATLGVGADILGATRKIAETPVGAMLLAGGVLYGGYKMVKNFIFGSEKSRLKKMQHQVDLINAQNVQIAASMDPSIAQGVADRRFTAAQYAQQLGATNNPTGYTFSDKVGRPAVPGMNFGGNS